MFSPDELYLNKLDGPLKETIRNGTQPLVVEAASHRNPVRTYLPGNAARLYPHWAHESVPFVRGFPGIIHTVMVQYAKFANLKRKISRYRPRMPRDEHISASGAQRVLAPELELSQCGAQSEARSARVHLSPHANYFLSTMAHCLRSNDHNNLIVGSKQPTPVWLSVEEGNAASSVL